MRNALRVGVLLGIFVLTIVRAYATETVPAAAKQAAGAQKPKAAAKAAVAKSAKAVAKKIEAATPEEDVKKTRRIVEGKVVGVSKRSISVEFENKPNDFSEMLLPLAADLKVEGATSISELKMGDRVKVGIEQAQREVSGSEPVLLKTEALVVILVQRAADAAAGAASVQ